MWGGGVFGSSLALSGYRFKAGPAMDKTWTHRHRNKAKLDLSGVHNGTGADKTDQDVSTAQDSRTRTTRLDIQRLFTAYLKEREEEDRRRRLLICINHNI